MGKLTEAQYRMLKSIRDHGDPFYHLSGRSERGGGTRTLASLYAQWFVDRESPVIMLSVSGENALNEAERRTTGSDHE